MDWMVNWWTWAIFALALVILEIMAPAFVLLGFGIGAGGIALLLLIGGPALFGGSLPWVFAVWAVLSLIAWIALQQVFKMPRGQSKTFDHDIND